MIKFIITIVLAGVVSFACSNATKSNKELVSETSGIAKNESNQGLVLLQQKCYACHSVTTKSHDDIIAPPMIAVKKRYMVEYSTKEAFVKAFQEWALNPTKEKALMFGAVAKFKVMPKQEFNANDIAKIATYIYENEIEKPSWFDAHFENQHPDGMGKFKGRMGK